jgi:hypothetical protein
MYFFLVSLKNAKDCEEYLVFESKKDEYTKAIIDLSAIGNDQL